MLAGNRGCYRVIIHDIPASNAPFKIAVGDSLGPPRALAFSPDGRFLLIPDYGGASLKVFTTPRGDLERASGKDGEGWSVPFARLKINRERWVIPSHFAFTTDGRAVIFSTGLTPALWRFAEERLQETDIKAPAPILTLTLSPDGQHLATADRSNSIQIRDVETLEVRSGWRMGLGADVSVLAYSPDGKSLATGDARGFVRLFDATTGEPLIELKEHTGRVEFLRFSPDEAHLASDSPEDGRGVVWHSAWPKS